MPNNCYFIMKIAGREDAVAEFIQMLKHEGPFLHNGLGRVFSFDEDPTMTQKHRLDPFLVAITGQGDCADSMRTAFGDWPFRSLESEIARLDLAVEAFSSEPGCGFQEHFLIDRDNVVIWESVDYEEHSIEGAEESYIQKVMKDHNLSREELMSKVNCNGDFTVGGFDNFANFDALTPYFTQMYMKWYKHKDPHTNELRWWTQRDKNGVCFEIKELPISKKLRLFVNDVKKQDFDTLSEAQRAAAKLWNYRVTPERKASLGSVLQDAQIRSKQTAQEVQKINRTQEGR